MSSHQLSTKAVSVTTTHFVDGMAVPGPFATMKQVRLANAALGHQWFDPSALRFFRSRIGSTVYGGRFFTSSEQGPNGVRLYSVRVVADDGSIDTVGEFQAYVTLKRAKGAAKVLADGSHEMADHRPDEMALVWKETADGWEATKGPVTCLLELEDEEVHPCEHYASGDDRADAEDVVAVLRDREINQWAWCSVSVKASAFGCEGVEYLGCCNYRDFAEFSQSDGYLPQMVDSAVSALAIDVAEMVEQAAVATAWLSKGRGV